MAVATRPASGAQGALKCRRKFLRFFPKGFYDRKYIDWERGYKWEAHERWQATLGRDAFRAMIAESAYAEIARRAVTIESRTNLLFSFEKMALRDAVKPRAGARAFGEGLYDLLHGSGGHQHRFERWCEAVAGLPRRQTRVLTWPVVTVFGFLAQPELHFFLKPMVTRAAAREYGLDFEYRSRPNWATYSHLLGLARSVAKDLKDLRPRLDRHPVVPVGAGLRRVRLTETRQAAPVRLSLHRPRPRGPCARRGHGGIIALPQTPASMPTILDSLRAATLLGFSACASVPHTAIESAPSPGSHALPTIAAATAGMDRRDGFIPLYIDDNRGKLYLEIPRDSTRVLMFVTLATGLGSNPIGLDRGADGPSYVARFDRSGDRVLVVFENWSYRSSARGNPDQTRAVLEAFPASTAASLPIIAREGERMVVDVTDFVMRDWNDVVGKLESGKQGTYAVARDRSTVYRPYTKAFPENTEIDVALTFATLGKAGPIIAAIVPDGKSFTLRQHISLLPLPDSGYRPRALDPRVGYFGIVFKDYAQPIQQPLEQRWIARHRLERVNPADPNSPIKNPLIYYIDRGIPEPIRTATKEGVSWWTEAFDRAGLRGGFKVEDLPEGVDPMDARYNVVQWENRNERGWSVGGSLGDPRTGEIIKAMARLDSHRARTDYNIYAGLFGADAAAADTAFVLARVRQVSAHEVGHTLGLAHNYIASTYDRGSVMDYPPPRVTLDARGNIDISSAYAVGPGPYDVFAIHWGYGIFPPGSENDSLHSIVADALRRGLLFLSDADARPDFSSDPRANLWDDASSASEFLRHEMDVRRVAMSRFSERNIRVGEPIALLQERFAPLYFMHRFALNALTKTIGGMEYANAVRGDMVQATHPIDAETQRRALASLTRALQPSELAIPDTVLTLLAPRPFSYPPYAELFGGRTRPAFDELGAARTLAQMIVDGILQPERAARVIEFQTRMMNPLTLGQIVDALTPDWTAPDLPSPKLESLRRVAQRAVVDRLLLLAADKEAAPEVRALVELKMGELRARSHALAASGDEQRRAHWSSISGDLNRWLTRQALPSPTPALGPPPGDPFGLDW